mgnify:CR=1 FL=1
MKIEIYNEEGILVATDMEQILELLELNGYEVKEIKEERKTNEFVQDV